MSLELTPDGTEAYRILRWAQEDPAAWRVAEAQRQMTALARPLLGDTAQAQALAEVQDAGTMLSRLAGAVAETAQGPAEDGGTISAQALGLASGYDLNPRSGMISLDLPPGVITPVPGGVSDHHITVVYLGPDVDDEAFAQACDRARQAATAMPGPLVGMVGGIGTFPASDGSDGKVPAWAGVVLPGAEQVRAALEDLSASEHPNWKPHVTVAYTEPGEPLPAPVPQMQAVFTHLSVHRGDEEVQRFPLGGSVAAPVTVSGQVSS